MSRHRSGFTLVELLVVIAIIGVLVALLLPAVQAAREAARRSSCNNNLKQLAIAIHNYHDTYNMFPYGGAGTSGHGQHSRLLPYIEQKNVYDLINYSVSVNNALNDVPRNTKIATFLCPSDPDQLPQALGGRNNYYANMGTNIMYTTTDTAHPNFGKARFNGAFMSDEMTTGFRDILDGTSNTAMFSEKNKGDGTNAVSTPDSDTYRPGTYPDTADGAMADCLAVDVTDLSKQGNSNVGAPWMSSNHSVSQYWHVLLPNTRSCMYPSLRIATTANSRHPGGVQMALCDGSVRFVSQTINLATWRALGTRAGKEVIPGDY